MKTAAWKALKIFTLTLCTIAVVLLASGLVIFSTPTGMDWFAHTLIGAAGGSGHVIDFQTYTKEEFAGTYLNTSLGPDDDFIALFEVKFGSEHRTDGLLLVTYDIRDPGDHRVSTLYGINRYTGLVYTNTRWVEPPAPEERRP